MADVVNQPHYTMKLEGVEKNILSYMNQQRKTNGPGSCEVVLLANNMKHYAHKIVLVSYSDFFRTYFGEGEKENENSSHLDAATKITGQALSTVHLPGINSIELEPILEYMYTSTLELKAQNINEILLVACLLQVTSVIEFCAEVMCQQPNWKSPLVSKRITNFVRNSAQSRKDPAPLTPTAVTWATNGGKPASHESRPRRKGRTLGSGWIKGKHENKQTGTHRRRRDAHTDPTGGRYHPTKRGRSDYAALIASETRRNRQDEHLYPRRYAQDNIAFDYPLTIDYDDLDRNMPLIEAGKMRSIFRTQEPNTMVGRPFPYHERTVHVDKASTSWGAISRSLSNKPQMTTYSAPQNRDNVTADSSRHQNVPQLIDCRNLWQVAQATALGLQVYPTGSSDFRLVRGSDLHQPASATDSTEDDASANPTFQSHRFARRRFDQKDHSDVDTNSLHGRQDSRLLASQPTTKRDSLDELCTAQDSPINLSRPVFVPTGRQKNDVEPKPKCSDREIPLTGRRDFTNSVYSSFSKPSKADRNSLESTKQSTDSRVDYHQRKRKLLLGALDQNGHDSNAKSAKISRPTKQQQCSSEDDILSGEYSRNHRDSGSDLDSDDSGRPSSV